MKYFIGIFLSFICALASNAQDQSAKPLTIGEVHHLQSSVLNEERRLNIYLPEKYDSSKEYPVIYLLDGSFHEDFLHVVGLVQFFNLQFQMPAHIIVGIENVDRKRDFTYHTDIKELQESYPTTGHSANFIKFIETELQPYIQGKFKTSATKYLIGQSLGGLLASEILLTKPALFSHYLIVSPSLWWDDQSLLHNGLKEGDINAYVYVSVGEREHEIMRKDADALSTLLKQSNRPNLKVDYVFMANENHATILHRSLYEAFLRLFPYKE